MKARPEVSVVFPIILGLAILLLLPSPAFANLCVNTSVSARLCVTQTVANQMKNYTPAWKEDASLRCSGNNSCCAGAGGGQNICVVKMVANTPSCTPNEAKDRRCALSAPSGSWSKDTTLACNTGNDCCPDNGVCWKKPADFSAGVDIGMNPLSSKGQVETNCAPNVTVTQNNARDCYDNVSMKIVGPNGAIPHSLLASDTALPYCKWIWKVTAIFDPGNHNVSFYRNGDLVLSEVFKANASVNAGCPLYVKDCAAFCDNNASVQGAENGCGKSPCGVYQMRMKKSCAAQCADFYYCSGSGGCSPTLSLSNLVSNEPAGTYSIRLSASVSGAGDNTASAVEYFIDGIPIGANTIAPSYPVDKGGYAPSSHHTYYAIAHFGADTLHSSSYDLNIPAGNSTPTTCECTAFFNVSCGGGTCPANYMYQGRTCNPRGCHSESICTLYPACTPPTTTSSTTTSTSSSTTSVPTTTTSIQSTTSAIGTLTVPTTSTAPITTTTEGTTSSTSTSSSTTSAPTTTTLLTTSTMPLTTTTEETTTTAEATTSIPVSTTSSIRATTSVPTTSSSTTAPATTSSAYTTTTLVATTTANPSAYDNAVSIVKSVPPVYIVAGTVGVLALAVIVIFVLPSTKKL